MEEYIKALKDLLNYIEKNKLRCGPEMKDREEGTGHAYCAKKGKRCSCYTQFSHLNGWKLWHCCGKA